MCRLSIVVSHHIFKSDGFVSAFSLSPASWSQCDLHGPQELQSRLNGASEANGDAAFPIKNHLEIHMSNPSALGVVYFQNLFVYE